MKFSNTSLAFSGGTAAPSGINDEPRNEQGENFIE